MDFPAWLQFAEDENTAAAMVRRVARLPKEWGELIAAAQTIVSYEQDRGEPSAIAPLRYAEDEALPLTASARILDSASQRSVGLDERERRHLALSASVAFAMYGNFPSAAAAAKQIKLSDFSNSPNVAVVLATAVPSRVPEMLGIIPDQGLHRSYLEALESFILSGDERQSMHIKNALDMVFSADMLPFEGSLYGPTAMALEHVRQLSISRVLRSSKTSFPDGYIERLVDSRLRVLLPSQLKALTDGRLLSSSVNAIISLPTGTGKTLLGELAAVAALSNAPGLTCYLTPYIALGTQVARALKTHIGESIPVHRLMGGFREAERLDPFNRQEVVVATPSGWMHCCARNLTSFPNCDWFCATKHI